LAKPRKPKPAAAGNFGSGPAPAAAPRPEKEIRLYWAELQDLKALSICVALYRDRLHWWVRTTDIVRGLASIGSAGGWLKAPQFQWFWAAVIAGAQALEAFKSAFPFAKMLRGAAILSGALEALYIDAETDWLPIDGGTLSGPEILLRRKKLQTRRNSEIKRQFPDGLRLPKRLKQVAETDAKAYFAILFGDGV
jgi:hypothetical protein